MSAEKGKSLGKTGVGEGKEMEEGVSRYFIPGINRPCKSRLLVYLRSTVCTRSTYSHVHYGALVHKELYQLLAGVNWTRQGRMRKWQVANPPDLPLPSMQVHVGGPGPVPSSAVLKAAGHGLSAVLVVCHRME